MWKESWFTGGFPGGEGFFRQWVDDGMTGAVPDLEPERQPSADAAVAARTSTTAMPTGNVAAPSAPSPGVSAPAKASPEASTPSPTPAAPAPPAVPAVGNVTMEMVLDPMTGQYKVQYLMDGKPMED
eukprot:CAMPEP_0184686060 /NCGR_PEP_ID=MMETSP0312-20130426/21175_1 /TAXON_ID=31354 /ORGANISM="Compsopogon coeruleus, Strain SAG 36.94" /LENGTH=126 /DNA_ID=CAMNT_0027140777 /DNA_START=124 /DNA_END=504 /DNA_ORIENTATION=+